MTLRHEEVAVGRRRRCRSGVDRSSAPGGDEDLLVERVGQRGAGPVLLTAPTGGVGTGRQVRVAPDPGGLAAERRRPGRGHVDAVLVVDPDALGGGDGDVDLAVGDLEGVERREPHDQLAVALPLGLVADVGGHDAPVGEEPAAVVLGVVLAALEGRHELADLLRPELTDRLAGQLEDAPALGASRRLAGVLTRDEPVRAVGEEADLRVDVEAGGIVGDGGDHALMGERRLRVVGVQVVALAVEHDRRGRRRGAGGAGRSVAESPSDVDELQAASTSARATAISRVAARRGLRTAGTPMVRVQVRKLAQRGGQAQVEAGQGAGVRGGVNDVVASRRAGPSETVGTASGRSSAISEIRL